MSAGNHKSSCVHAPNLYKTENAAWHTGQHLRELEELINWMWAEKQPFPPSCLLCFEQMYSWNDKVFLCDYPIRHNRSWKKMLIEPDLPVPTVPLRTEINRKNVWSIYLFVCADITIQADSAARLNCKGLAISLVVLQSWPLVPLLFHQLFNEVNKEQHIYEQTRQSLVIKTGTSTVLTAAAAVAMSTKRDQIIFLCQITKAFVETLAFGSSLNSEFFSEFL